MRTGLCHSLVVLLLLASAALAAENPPQEKLPQGAKVVRVEAEPAQIALKHRFDYVQLLLTAELDSGDRVDVTRLAQVDGTPELVKLSPTGIVRPAADGSAELKFTFAGQTVSVPVAVSGQKEHYAVNFVRDVMPTLSKVGCNAGTCHGSAEGKNGFKLSLRGYDALFDHRALVDDLAGRRFNRADPDQSLMLLKPSGGVPHSGGVHFEPSTPYYELLRAWIGDGVQYDANSPRVTSIEIFPKGPVVPLPEMKQQMRVAATFSDGLVRDVTAEAFIESSNTEVATADKQGLVTAVRRGESAMLARYEGTYTATTMIVMGDRRGFVWKGVPEYNTVDTLVYEKLRQVKTLPSGVCSDAEFIRRVYIDLTGLPPQPEQVRAFLADRRNPKVKRDELVDTLVGSPAYVEYWTNKWADLLQVNRKFLTEKGAWSWREWIKRAVQGNMPYDQFAHTILTANGSTYDNPPASYLRVLRDPGAAVENTTQLFLAIRFNCNKCHDHPFERWTQNQYYHLAAYFAQVGRKRGPEEGEEIIYDTGAGEVIHPKTGRPAEPTFPYEHADRSPADATRREQLAHWITSKENPYFARSLVNRLWSYLMGVGLIEPVDDTRAGNPASNPKLLDWLSNQFIASGFDVQHMVRTICKSRVYQHAIATNEWNEGDEINYSHAIARRLSAESLYDAIHHVTGTPLKLPGVPAGFRAVELPDTNVEIADGFLNLFGRPPRESACECERSGSVMLGPVMKLVNGPTIANAIADPNNRITKLVANEPNDDKVVEELFVAILNRPPTDREIAAGRSALASGDRLAGAQDLAWALLNSPAFLFNH